MSKTLSEDVVKSAQEIAKAFVQIRELKAELKEKNKNLRQTGEYETMVAVRKAVKKFEEDNPQYASLKNELKKAREEMKNTPEYQEVHKATEIIKEYKDSIKEVARDMAEGILDNKIAGEEDEENGDEQ